MSWRAAFVCILLLGAAAAQAGDTIYRSTGPDGKVTYSQTPPAGSKTDKKLEFEHLPATPLPDYVLKFRKEMERNIAARQLPPEDPVAGLRLFSAKWCGYCKQAKAWLGQRGVPYQELDIDTPEGMTAFARTGAKVAVPLLLGANVRLQGFSPQAYQAVLAQPR